VRLAKKGKNNNNTCSSKKISATMNIHHNNSMEVDDDNNHLDVDLMEDVDVVQVAIDLLTEALLYIESHYGMTHYINDQPTTFDGFNELLVVFFEMELSPSTKSLARLMLLEPCFTTGIIPLLRSFPADEMA
jgi:hypothetical protein